ncbi:hypothetical protein SAMN02745111_01985 [Eubacterium uniforme]|uniref:Uncharacterized protein n=1 Tax=Eubacterium uniforme TaxID=39495 RepID=A0A1T4VZ30_9FIRM|nr:hypothetical protein [Eubacterium uniforme]SKA70243.1 hypothetical protein SAMN02745111_01985 [Eubacterium uniforme]
MNKKRKRYIVICIIILLLFSYWMLRYNSLEKKIIIGNINHFFDVDFDKIYVVDDDKEVCICFKHLIETKDTHKIIKDIAKKCKKIVCGNKNYVDYDVCVYYTHAHRTMFSIRIKPDNEVYSIYSSININKKVVIPFSTISKDYPDIKKLVLDDYYPESELNDIKNYKNFNELEVVEYSTKPSDEVIRYLKEKFPNCKIEY